MGGVDKILVKENSSTKIIEDKMGFKFKDLILIGKNESIYTTRILYKDDNNIFIFFLYDSKEIRAIRKTTNMKKEYDEIMVSLEINGKNYYCKTKEVLLINEVFKNESKYNYTFLYYDDEGKNENFVLSEPIELQDEESVIITLSGSFFDDSKI